MLVPERSVRKTQVLQARVFMDTDIAKVGLGITTFNVPVVWGWRTEGVSPFSTFRPDMAMFKRGERGLWGPLFNKSALVYSTR